MSNLTHQIVDLPIGAMTLVARDGSLIGYAGGLERKRFLVDLEDTHRG